MSVLLFLQFNYVETETTKIDKASVQSLYRIVGKGATTIESMIELIPEMHLQRNMFGYDTIHKNMDTAFRVVKLEA